MPTPSRSPQAQIAQTLQAVWRQAQRDAHRFYLVVRCEDATSYARALFAQPDIAALLPRGEILTLGVTSSHPLEEVWTDRDRLNLSWAAARSRLGGSEAALLIDASEGIRPDALAAALGVIRGGGLILFCLPPQPPQEGSLKEHLAVWPRSSDQVGHRLWTQVWSSLTSPEFAKPLGEGVYVARSTWERAHPDHTPPSSSPPLSSPPLSSPPLSSPPLSSPPLPSALSALKSLSPSKSLPSVELSSHPPHLREVLSAHPRALTLIERRSLTLEQRDAILIALNSHYREAFTAVALTAQRGRGKSSALGILAAALLLTGEGEVGITAPSLYAVEALFEHARLSLESAQINVTTQEGALATTAGVIRYWSPQQLWTRHARPSLLLVDEAASLPVPLLERLLEWRPSLIFATTTQGYEGTGRGFSLRFRPLLQRRLRKLYEVTLTAPLRWSSDDPVEEWMMRALSLDVDLTPSKSPVTVDDYQYEQVSPDQLAQSPTLLREIFALLVQAHYRTQPSDLWRILDSPNLTAHLLKRSSAATRSGVNTPRVLAVALTSAEGALSPELAAQVFEGRVRPRGQLFAANLAVHLSCEEGATLKLERVVRIATRPGQQGRGAGSRLITAIRAWAVQEEIDLLGSSFGATEQLTRFWIRAGFTPLRVGVRQSHVSGERSLLVAQGLNPRSSSIISRLNQAHIHDLAELLRGPLSSLDPPLVYTLCASVSAGRDEAVTQPAFTSPRASLGQHDWETLGAVAFSGRAYELALIPARSLALAWLMDPLRDPLSSATLTPLGRLLITKVIQGQRWLEVTADAQLSSTSEAMKGLSAALRLLYQRFAPEWALEWVKRFPQYHTPATISAQLGPLTI